MTTAPKKTNTLIDEPLILSIFPISFLLKLDHKRFEILYWIMGIWAQSYCLYCLYDLTKHFDMFSSYITSIGIIQVGVINIPFIVDNRVFPGIRNIQLSLWPLDFGGEKLRKHLLLCNRKMKYDCLTIIIITFTMIFMLLLHGMVSSDVIINIKSSDEICGNWKTLCKITYIVYMEFTTYTSAVFVSITFYYMRIIRNQIILLNGVLENITKNIEFPPESEAYQSEIFIRLKFCISRHIELRRLFDALGVVKTWPVVVYFFCWTFVFTIELIMIFTASDIKSTLLGLLELIPTTISTIIFLKNSQGLINESLELNNVAAQCPYYDWNKKNRQALQMLLMNSTEPIKICTYSLLDLDYSLFISMLKIAYNLAVMVKYIDMRNKTNN